MALLLAIKKSKRGVGMDTLKRTLDEILTNARVTNIGKVGVIDDLNAPKFPCSYGYESAGEGGFIVDYSEGLRFATASGNPEDYILVDATISSIGATGSLIYRIDKTIRKNLSPLYGDVIDIPIINIG